MPSPVTPQQDVGRVRRADALWMNQTVQLKMYGRPAIPVHDVHGAVGRATSADPRHSKGHSLAIHQAIHRCRASLRHGTNPPVPCIGLLRRERAVSPITGRGSWQPAEGDNASGIPGEVEGCNFHLWVANFQPASRYSSRVFERYVAIGDSSTEGLDDPDGQGGYRGWANRLAETVATTQCSPLLYANLAIRGSSTRRIRDEQLEQAAALRPDLVTLFSGTNDVVAVRFDAGAVARDVELMQRRLIGDGAMVVGFTLPDLSSVRRSPGPSRRACAR